jgi:hypothetical protein
MVAHVDVCVCVCVLVPSVCVKQMQPHLFLKRTRGNAHRHISVLRNMSHNFAFHIFPPFQKKKKKIIYHPY